MAVTVGTVSAVATGTEKVAKEVGKATLEVAKEAKTVAGVYEEAFEIVGAALGEEGGAKAHERGAGAVEGSRRQPHAHAHTANAAIKRREIPTETIGVEGVLGRDFLPRTPEARTVKQLADTLAGSAACVGGSATLGRSLKPHARPRRCTTDDYGEPALVQESSAPAGVHEYTPRSRPNRKASLRATYTVPLGATATPPYEHPALNAPRTPARAAIARTLRTMIFSSPRGF